MASQSSFSEDDFSCSVCCDIFKDPVVLSCSHSFCKPCLQKWWTETPVKICPLCKEISSLPTHQNLVLKNLCEAFSQQMSQRALAGSEVLCSLHTEKLKLFCMNDQQPVCVVCRDSKKHTNHRFKPIDEAALDHREKLQKSVKPLQEKLKVFRKVKVNYDQMAQQIKVQTRQTELKIKEQFKKFSHFLKEEEEARIDALWEEEKKKSLMMKVKIEELSRNIETVSYSIRVIDEQLTAKHISFLHNYKTTMESVQQEQVLQDSQPVSGALMNVTNHLGNLAYKVWDKMKTIVSYNPVILDPNTAHPQLIVSDDLTSVRCGERQQLPDNPERFDYWNIVLASEGFNSGTHSWDVEVGEATRWEVGVKAESYPKKGKHGGVVWKIERNNGKYAIYGVKMPYTSLPLKQNLQKIRVQLDWNRGRLSFFDLDTNTYIHTITHTFTEKLFPFIQIDTENTVPFKLLPVKCMTRTSIDSGGSCMPKRPGSVANLACAQYL